MCLITLAVLSVIGCGGQDEVSKPSSVTEDQIREMDQAQQEVDAAEREQRKLNP
jgi:hypothetical protein